MRSSLANGDQVRHRCDQRPGALLLDEPSHEDEARRGGGGEGLERMAGKVDAQADEPQLGRRDSEVEHTPVHEIGESDEGRAAFSRPEVSRGPARVAEEAADVVTIDAEDRGHAADQPGGGLEEARAEVAVDEVEWFVQQSAASGIVDRAGQGGHLCEDVGRGIDFDAAH
jgi:hypothetical protein